MPKVTTDKPQVETPPNFPLTRHPSGVWCKKIKGKLHYFGPLSDPAKALAKYDREKDDLQAGRKPRPEGDTTPRLKDLANRFLTAKISRVHSGELSLRSFDDYKRTCATVLEVFGKDRAVADLDAADFEKLRNHLAAGRGMVSLTNYIRLVRMLFKYAYDVEILDKPFRFMKAALAPPGRKDVRRERNAKPLRMFQPDELRKILSNSKPVMRAMVLLAINGGLGQSDLSALPITALNLDTGWLDFPRVKTEVQRRIPLWPETVKALREVIAKRPQAKAPDASGCVFITKYGHRWVRATKKGDGPTTHMVYIDSISLEFGKLLRELKVKRDGKEVEIKREGLQFYGIRHTFETIGGEAKDQIPLDYLMGHAPPTDDMSAVYREQISEPRLKAVTEHVRRWLWPPKGSEATWIKADATREKRKAKGKATADK